MTQSETFKLTSLNLVHDELVAAIEQSASKLEQFVAQRENEELLNECIAGIKQISGTLELIQLRGADLLAGDLLKLAGELAHTRDEDMEEPLSVLTAAFFILSRYLEYVQKTRRSVPALLIPHINEMRQICKTPLLPESHFFQANVEARRKGVRPGSAVPGEEMAALVRRLRHMYQVGLLNVLKSKQIKPSLAMMQRALERLDIITGDRPMGKLWWVGSCAIEALTRANMDVTKNRKLLLGVIDRQLKLLQAGSESEFDREPNKGLIKELLYIVAISGYDSEKAKDVKRLFEIEPLGYNDKELRYEREALKGPSVNTFNSMAAVLKDELRRTKDILERASEGGTGSITDYDDLIDTLNKVAEILSLVGLVAPGNSLKQEIAKIETWRDRGKDGDAKDLLEIADVLLYVESAVSGLESNNLSNDSLSKVNLAERDEVIATSALAEAEAVVLKESESGLALVKRALNSFAESNYDPGHIKNVPSTLNALRGGMVLLNMQRAAAVLAASTAFVNKALLQGSSVDAFKDMLETFADAVIGLEYYLDAVSSDRRCEEQVLEIAEESLAALGYPVN